MRLRIVVFTIFLESGESRFSVRQINIRSLRFVAAKYTLFTHRLRGIVRKGKRSTHLPRARMRERSPHRHL